MTIDDKRVIEGILQNAEREAAQIIQKAEKSVVEQKSSFETGLKNITSETEVKIKRKLDELSKKAKASIEAETRRKNLRQREKINSEVNEIFFSKIEKLIPTAEYSDFLCKLIAEGAIAVNDKNAFVRCSFREKVSEEMLRKAEKIVLEETGRKVSLGISVSEPFTGPGIIVESSNGRISYNNQIESRLRRFDEDIKMIIISGLAKE